MCKTFTEFWKSDLVLLNVTIQFAINYSTFNPLSQTVGIGQKVSGYMEINIYLKLLLKNF